MKAVEGRDSWGKGDFGMASACRNVTKSFPFGVFWFSGFPAENCLLKFFSRNQPCLKPPACKILNRINPLSQYLSAEMAGGRGWAADR
jgi:hypothetical protein